MEIIRGWAIRTHAKWVQVNRIHYTYELVPDDEINKWTLTAGLYRYGFSPVWVRSCFLRSLWVVKNLSHRLNSHRNVSPVCRRSWAFNLKVSNTTTVQLLIAHEKRGPKLILKCRNNKDHVNNNHNSIASSVEPEAILWPLCDVVNSETLSWSERIF